MTQPPTGPGSQPYPPGAVPGQPTPPPYGQSGQPVEPTRPFVPGQYGPPQPGDATQQLPQFAAPQSAPPTAPLPPQSAPPAAPLLPQTSPPTAPLPSQPAPSFGAPVASPGYPQPTAGPAFGQPMSAPPGFAPPYGAPAPTGGGGRRAARILGVAAGLLLVLSVTMTGLYVNKSSDLERTEKRLTAQISERDGTIAANQTEIDKLRAELQTVREKLADTEQDLTGTRNDRDEQARQKQIIATCLDKLTRALAAAATNNKAAYDKATQGLNKVCDEAENYL